MGMQADKHTEPYRLTLILQIKIGAPLLPTTLGAKENDFGWRQTETILILAFLSDLCDIHFA